MVRFSTLKENQTKFDQLLVEKLSKCACVAVMMVPVASVDTEQSFSKTSNDTLVSQFE